MVNAAGPRDEHALPGAAFGHSGSCYDAAMDGPTTRRSDQDRPTGVWFFASDLHGRTDRYCKLFDAIVNERPTAVLLGGDLLPKGRLQPSISDGAAGGFVDDFLIARFDGLRAQLGSAYPRIFVILGNDDPRIEEDSIARDAPSGIWEYVHERRASCGGFEVVGYACVPPTPFLLKDWERYDVSRHIDVGCVGPEEGYRTVSIPDHDVRHGTIQSDLRRLFGNESLSRTICLFHSPPYRSCLDRAALDGRMIDHTPLDVHVGSVAIRRFIEERQPLVTLHGHVHESAGLTGAWREQMGRTHCFSAAHGGPELALVRFEPDDPAGATRSLL